MTKLPYIKPEKLGEAIRAIYPLYEKSCRIIEAQPASAGRLKTAHFEKLVVRDLCLRARASACTAPPTTHTLRT